MMRRHLFRIAACAVAAFGVLVVPVLADELTGRITAVNVDSKTLTVIEKGTDKEVNVTVTDDTVVAKGKGKTQRVNLEKMQKQVEKSKKGVSVEITHDKNVASKIVQKGGKKKEDAPKKDDTKKDEPEKPKSDPK